MDGPTWRVAFIEKRFALHADITVTVDSKGLDGPGGENRHPGTGIIGGMIGETTLAMLYVPLLFYLFDRLSERSKEKKKARPLEKTPAEGGAAQDAPP